MPVGTTDLAEVVLDSVRRAHDEVERRIASELERAFSCHAAMKKELDEARAKNVELQKDLDKMTTQKSYVTDAFEAGRKEMAKYKSEAALAAEEIARLRTAIEELQADRVAADFGKTVMDAEFSALETERDVIQRALGAATKQLFGKQQQIQQQQEAAAAAAANAKGGRGAQAKKPPARPTGKPLGSSPRVNTPTGGGGARVASGSRGSSPVPVRAAWN